ncbi:hypothetical protein DPM12_04540 [Phytoactinopolyspora halophila]|uniref:Uncharacterized protein n=1 Tax=Phytoactinopolyspora halophila TaxID=1981511 RepID=A0A329R2A9_9ACTN|nr:hypothetical protein DPM12_04540 [Phytoactinopolyspora halophila]
MTLISMGAVALVLTGCSADSPNAPSGSADGEESPLKEYMGVHYPGVDHREQAIIRADDPGMSEDERNDYRRVEQLVAQCMQEEGFEYVPRSADDQRSDIAEYEEAYSLGPEEFAEEHGYGITTLMFKHDDRPEDPNEEIRQNMSAPEREAYDRALNGEMDTDTTHEAEGHPGELPPEKRGCRGQATAEVYPETADAPVTEQFAGLMSDVASLHDRIRNDPRVTEAASDWQHCMADSGHSDLEHPDEAMSSVLQRMTDLRRSAQDEDSGDMEDGGTSEDLDQQQLAELQEYEVDVATADYACRQEHYNETYREVAFEMEQEFVERHEDELERFRDAIVRP